MTVVPPNSVGRTAMDRNDLLLRLASAVVLAPIALAAAYLGGWVASLTTALFSVIVVLEWQHIVGQGRNPDQNAPVVAVVASVFVAAAAIAGGMAALVTGLLVALLGALAVSVLSRDAWRGGGVIYAAVFGISLLALRRDPNGLAAVTIVFAISWATDSAAFFAGRLIGGPKLWPEVSPKKTWSGSFGGFATGVIAGLIAMAAFRVPIGAFSVLLIAAIAVAVQLGDLFESALKRLFGLKDASRLIPGHGGVMDRVDGLIFAAFAAVTIGLIHRGPDAIATGFVFW